MRLNHSFGALAEVAFSGFFGAETFAVFFKKTGFQVTFEILFEGLDLGFGPLAPLLLVLLSLAFLVFPFGTFIPNNLQDCVFFQIQAIFHFFAILGKDFLLQ